MRGFLMIVLLAASPIGSAELYKWTDADGRVHYSDRKPPQGNETQAIEGRVSGYTPVAVAQGAVAALGAVTREGEVVMFTTSGCPHCRTAKVWLSRNGIAYREINVEGSERNRRLFKSAGGKGVPYTVVNREGQETKIAGFSVGRFERVFGR